jgi:hypothetical protein
MSAGPTNPPWLGETDTAFTDTKAGPGTPVPPINPSLGLAFIFMGFTTIALGAVNVGRLVVVSVALEDNDAEGDTGEGGETEVGRLEDMADSI